MILSANETWIVTVGPSAFFGKDMVQALDRERWCYVNVERVEHLYTLSVPLCTVIALWQPVVSAEFVELIDTLSRTYNKPLVFFSRQQDVSISTACLNAGADAVIESPFIIDEVIARLRAIIRVSFGRQG